MKKIVASVLVLSLLSGCSTPEQKEKWKTVAAVAVVGLAVLAVAKGGGGGGGGQGYAAATVDTSWDWDRFYRDGAYYWACRGVQTGRYAEEWHCIGLTQTDYRWPG